MTKLTPAYLLLAALFTVFVFGATATSLQAAATTQDLPATTTPPAFVWEAITLPNGITATTINHLTVDPSNANIAYLATHKGLFKTNNGGQSWQRIGAAELDYLFDVTISSANPQRVYARSWNFYRSDDGGASWRKLNLPANACGVVAAPSDPDRLYARRCHDDKQTIVFRSLDGGQNWITPKSKIDQPMDWFAIAPHDPAILIGATFEKSYRSTDSGETWTQLAIGTRYSARPLFDPANPDNLYLAHWAGLLRSTDAGAGWLDSGADRELTSLIMAPDGSGALLGGNKSAAWRFTITNEGWSASAWDAPQGLLALWRSANDGQMIYAQNSAGLWRQRQVAAAPPFTPAAWVYLPVVQRSKVSQQAAEVLAAEVLVSAADPAGEVAVADVTAAGVDAVNAAADQAIARANEYRKWVGVIPLQTHAAINTGAQNHANYHMANHQDPAAWAKGAHGEVAGKPQFTGQWPSDRIKAAGFPWPGGAEVMHFIGDPVVSVDGWMATVYHRLPIIDPNAHYAGYGVGKNDKTAVDVMDFGGGPTAAGVWSPATPWPLAYPANGQTDVPISWGGGESPNPLPPGTPGPVGYPFTLQPIGGKLQVDRAELRTAAGQVAAVHPNPADCAKGACYTLIAVAPLQPNTEYIVDAAGNVDGFAFQQQWRFTTGASSVVAAAVPPEILVTSEQ